MRLFEILFLFTNLNLYIVRGLTSNYIILISNEFNYNWQYQSYFFIFFIVGYMVSSILSTLLSKRLNQYIGLSIGLLLWSIGNLGIGFKQLIFPSRFLIGFGDGVFQCIMPSIIKNNLVDNQKTLRGIYSISSIGVGLGNLISGVYFKWNVMYLILAVFPIITSIYILLKKNSMHIIKMENSNIFSSMINVLKNRTWILITIGYMFSSMILSDLVIWMPTYLKSKYTDLNFRYMMVLYSIIVIISSLITLLTNNFIFNKLKIYVDKVYIVTSVVLYLIMLTCLQVYLELDNYYIYLALHFIFILASSLVAVCYSLAILDVIKVEDAPASVALSIILVNLFGAIVSPLISSYINDMTGSLYLTFHIIGCSLFLASIFNFIALKKNRMEFRNLDEIPLSNF
jgi:cyanate permease